MALCKGLLCISNPISATRPSGRVASSVGNSLAAAIFHLGQVTRPSFLTSESEIPGGVGWCGVDKAPCPSGDITTFISSFNKATL